MTNSSEGLCLRYVSHTQTDMMLEIIQNSELVEVKTVFTLRRYKCNSHIYGSKEYFKRRNRFGRSFGVHGLGAWFERDRRRG